MEPCAALPVKDGFVSSHFGMRRAGLHYGVDVTAPDGSPVYAVLPGRVRFTAENGKLERYGNTVIVDHGPYLSLYAHLQSILVHPGQDLAAGELVGTVGRTSGTRDEPDATFFTTKAAHLHLEFLERWPVLQGGGGRLDPGPIFARLGIMAPEQGPLQSVCGGNSRASKTGLGVGALLVAGGALLWLATRKRG